MIFISYFFFQSAIKAKLIEQGAYVGEWNVFLFYFNIKSSPKASVFYVQLQTIFFSIVYSIHFMLPGFV